LNILLKEVCFCLNFAYAFWCPICRWT